MNNSRKIPKKLLGEFAEYVLTVLANFTLCVVIAVIVPGGVNLPLFMALGFLTCWNNGNAFTIFQGRLAYEKLKAGLNDKAP